MNTLYLALFIQILGISAYAQQIEVTPHSVSHLFGADEEKHSPIEIEGILRLDNDFNPDENGSLKENLRFQKFELQAKIPIAQKLPFHIAQEITLAVRSKLEKDIISNGISQSYDVRPEDLLKLIKEGYIIIQNIGDRPVALVVCAACEYSYGQDLDGTLSLQNDANHGMSDPDQGQAKGFIVVLDKSVKHIFDKVEAGIFTSNGDIKNWHSKLDAFAFRITKDLSESLVVEASVMHKENSYDPDLKPDTRLSIGGIFRNGRWTLWGEGFVMKHAETYPNAPLGITGGVSRITGPGRITFNAVGIQNTLRQYASGYDLYVTPKWTVGPTYRYTSCKGGNAGCMDARGFGQGSSLGISARYAIGADNENPTWIGMKGVAAVRRAFGGRSGEKHNTVNHPSGSQEFLK